VATKKGHPGPGRVGLMLMHHTHSSVEGSWSTINVNSTTNLIHLSMPKIYLLRRDDDERMVTVDDDRMGRMRMLL
jgi:hypothetical protein